MGWDRRRRPSPSLSELEKFLCDRALQWGPTVQLWLLALLKIHRHLGLSGGEKKWLLGRQIPCPLVRDECSRLNATGMLVEGIRKTMTTYLFPIE